MLGLLLLADPPAATVPADASAPAAASASVPAAAAASAPAAASASAPTPTPAPAPAPAPAGAPTRTRGEFQIALGLAGGATDWSGDYTGYGALKLGLRLFRIAGPFVEGRLGYGIVDQRLLTLISVGIEGGAHIHDRFFPRGFVAFVHQHEESMAAVAEEPFGAVLGIGNGIRHRAGAKFGAGLDIVVHRGKTYDLTLGPEVTFAYLTYSSGPSWYGMVGAVAGGNFRVF